MQTKGVIKYLNNKDDFLGRVIADVGNWE